MKQESVPGLRPTLKQRIDNPDLKPEKETVLTLQEIEMWLHKWVVDEYHLTNQYNEHVLAPYLRLTDAQNGQTDLVFPIPREPPTFKREIDDLYLAVLERDTRILSKEGVQWLNLRYNNRILVELYKKHGKKEVTILRDTRDVRHIWVLDPLTDKPIQVGLGAGWAATLLETHGDKPVHESAWKRNVNEVRKHVKERLTPYLYKKHASKELRFALLDDSIKKQKRVRKEREKAKETSRNQLEEKVSMQDEKQDDRSLPEKEEEQKPGKKIDWSKIKKLPTDSFYSGR